MSQIFRIDEMTAQEMAFVAAQIDAGAVAVFPTDTVYGIGTNAFCEESIGRIYALKERPATAALQILVGSVEQAKKVVTWPDAAEKLAQAFWPGGLTVILPANEKGTPLLRGFAGLGLRVPAHAKLAEILTMMQNPLASTSANKHAMPVITEEKILLEFFEGKADIILLGGKCSALASTVIDLSSEPALLREGAIFRQEIEKILGLKVK